MNAAAILERILSDLPTSRDWLDPALEAMAREAIAEQPKPTPPVEICKEDVDRYYDAYSARCSGIARHCRCGKIYYNADRPGWFEEGELEGYRNNSNAFHVDYEPGGVYVLGIEYCNACDCWHQKAQQVVNLLRAEKKQIGAFYRLERQALLDEAAATPQIPE